MRVLFAGTPSIAVPSLSAVCERHHVVGVLTAPDTHKGRGRKLVHNPVKERALELGLPVLQPERLGSEARRAVTDLAPELLAVFAYGRIFGPKFLSLFPRGAVNVHPSLLPRYRGSAPVVAPILNGDEETGVSVQTVELEVDSGDILGRRRVGLDGSETAGSLSQRMAREGAQLLGEVLGQIEGGSQRAEPQSEEEVTVCRRLEKRDGLIHWALPVEMIERMVRAFIPWPKAYTFWGERRLSILRSHICAAHGREHNPGEIVGMDRAEGILVQTGRGVLGVEEIQLEGKKALRWEEFLNGNRDFLQAHLGVHE